MIITSRPTNPNDNLMHVMLEACKNSKVFTPSPGSMTAVLIAWYCAKECTATCPIDDKDEYQYYDWCVLSASEQFHDTCFQRMSQADYLALPWKYDSACEYLPLYALDKATLAKCAQHYRFALNKSLTVDFLRKHPECITEKTAPSILQHVQFESMQEVKALITCGTKFPATLFCQHFLTTETLRKYVSTKDPRDTITIGDSMYVVDVPGMRHLIEHPSMTLELYDTEWFPGSQNVYKNPMHLVFNPNATAADIIDRCATFKGDPVSFVTHLASRRNDEMKSLTIDQWRKMFTDLSYPEGTFKVELFHQVIQGVFAESCAVVVDVDEQGRFLGISNCLQTRVIKRLRVSKNDYDAVSFAAAATATPDTPQDS